jgi:hypothetical protein
MDEAIFLGLMILAWMAAAIGSFYLFASIGGPAIGGTAAGAILFGSAGARTTFKKSVRK